MAARLAALFLASAVAVAGCADDDSTESSSESRPLQPLVYTETPDRSPEAEAARERRLMRELLRGAQADGGSWGTMKSGTQQSHDPPTSAEELGRVLFRAVFSRNDRAWHRSFIDPQNYASLVEVSLAQARTFADDQRAGSLEVRRTLHPENPSEAPAEGLSSVFNLVRLELGDGRTIDGSLAEDDDTVVQYWSNRLYLSVRNEDAELYVRVPKILRVPAEDVARGPDGEDVYVVGSTLALGPRLRIFLQTGMQLKPKLLDSGEYPIPLAVGNYWRYARRVGRETDSDDGAGSDGAAVSNENSARELQATKVTLKVRSIDRFGARRLVGLQWLYNDPDLSRSMEHWVITPRRIYLCPSTCQRRVDELKWLLNFLRRETPIFRFPLAEGDAWGTETPSEKGAYRVTERSESLELPAGSFFGTFRIIGTGRLRHRGDLDTIEDLERSVAPGTGVVRRRYQIGGTTEAPVVETLVDYRLMTR